MLRASGATSAAAAAAVAAGTNWLTQMAGNTRKSKRKGATRCQRVKKRKKNEDEEDDDDDDDDGTWTWREG
jgi:hypothetical protein